MLRLLNIIDNAIRARDTRFGFILVAIGSGLVMIYSASHLNWFFAQMEENGSGATSWIGALSVELITAGTQIGIMAFSTSGQNASKAKSAKDRVRRVLMLVLFGELAFVGYANGLHAASHLRNASAFIIIVYGSWPPFGQLVAAYLMQTFNTSAPVATPPAAPAPSRRNGTATPDLFDAQTPEPEPGPGPTAQKKSRAATR